MTPPAATPDPQPATPSKASAAKPARKRGSRRKQFFSWLIVLAVLLGAYWLLCHSFLTRRMLMPRIANALGVPVQVSSVDVFPFGRLARIRVQDVHVRAPGVEGTAGEVVQARAVEVTVPLWAAIRGHLQVQKVVVDHPIIRVSQSLDDATVNVASLRPFLSTTPSSSGPPVIAELFVQGGEVQLGEHTNDGKTYTVLKSFFVSGRVERSADKEGTAIISFRETQESGSAVDGLVAQGKVTKDDLTLTLTGVDLSAVKAENVPRPVRDMFKQITLEGKVPQADVTYSFAGGWKSRFVLQDVALNLPVPVQPDEDDNGNPIPVAPGQQNRRLRITHTSGEMIISNTGASGRVTGQVEDFPYDVRFSVDGVSMDSPWTCTLVTRGFRLEQRPEILKFAPGIVRRRVRDFSDPTGILDAEITVSSKGVPNGESAQPISVRGSLFLKDVTAAFHRFPYRFKNLQGEVSFDDERVLISNIRGTSDSGAIITAEGKIEPTSGEDQGFNLDVFVSNLRLDDAVQHAMEARGQKDVLPTLLDIETYTKFVTRGLIRPPTTAANALIRNPDAPVFDLGGTVEVHVEVWRPRGLNVEWQDAVTIVLPDVGVLPKAFPYPLRAKGVTIFQKDNIASVYGGELVGLKGGTGSILARAEFTQSADQASGAETKSGDEFVPDVQISAKGFPLDELLLAALPTPHTATTPLGETIAPLHPSGLVDATLRVRLDEHGEARYAVDARASDASLSPIAPDGSQRIGVQHASGTLTVGDDSLDLAVQGMMQAVSGSSPGKAGVAPVTCRVVAGDALEDFAPDAPRDATRVSIAASDIDLETALEDFARCFAPKAADSMMHLRELHQPRGIVGGQLTVDLLPGGHTRTHLTAVPASEMSALIGPADANGARTRVALSHPQGTVELSTDDAPGVYLHLERAGGEIVGADGSAGSFVASGDIHMAQEPVQDELDLRIGANGVRAERSAGRASLMASGAESVLDTLDEMRTTVLCDADLAVSRGPQGPADVRGRVFPRSLTMELDDGPMTLPSLSGSVVLEGNGGRLDAIRAITPDWDLLVEGPFERSELLTSFDTNLTLSARRLSPDLRALLPRAMRETLTDLNAQVDGPLVTVDTPLRMTVARDGRGVQSVSTSGSIALDRAAMDIGVRVADATALLDFKVEASAEKEHADVTLSGELPAFRAGGVEMRQGRFDLQTTPSGDVDVRTFSARAHGGRISGAVRVGQTRTTSDFVGPPLPGRPFELAVEGSNVRFASLVEDLRARNEARDPIDRAVPPAADGSRGALSGSFTLSGVTSAPSLLRGRGNFVVRGGRVVSLPTLVPLIRVTNLELPNDEPLDYAMADFYLEGGILNFEQINISSASVGLYGFGTATWPKLGMDMRFRAGNRSRIPIITPLLEGVRGELATAVVTGSVDDPKVTTVSFDRTRKVLDDLFGREKSPEQRRLDRIEQQVSPSQRRERKEELPPVEPSKGT